MLSLFKTYRLSHYAWLALTAASLMINETSRASSVAPGEDDKIQAYQKQVRQVVAEVSGAVLKLYRFNPETGDRRFTGSSVVVSPDGLVLTVAHVNEPGRIYIGRFPDGREVHVKGLGEINSLDAAMMRIQETGNYPYVKLGYSSGLKHGEPVIAFGYAGSLQHDFPAPRLGFVVRQQRREVQPERMPDTAVRPRNFQGENPGFARRGMGGMRAERLQTTALMEPGDSGGAVFDLKGNLIGLRSSINQPLDVNMEIPIDHYHKFWQVLLEGKEFRTAPDSLAVPINPQATYAQFVDAGFAPYSDTTAVFLTHFAPLKTRALQVSSESSGNSMESLATAVQWSAIPSPSRSKAPLYLISKSSLVGENPVVHGFMRKSVPATVRYRDEVKDLVLLEVEHQKGFEGVSLDQAPDSVSYATIGVFTHSPLVDGQRRLSVLGTAPFAIPGMSRAGYFGAGLDETEVGLVFRNVRPDSPAGQAQFQAGMQLISVDGAPIRSASEFIRIVQSKRPGDRVLVEYRHEEGQHQKEVVLGKRPLVEGEHIAERFEGGKSLVRDGFSRVFAHDARLLPAEMGGPVIGADGTFYGINIARLSRTSTLAVPVDELKKFLLDAFAESK